MFRNFILQNFPFLEDDFDALTDYELFCKFITYVKKCVKDNEEFKKQIAAMENYIYNLDLQDEVDKKLDEMAESGELAEIIAQFIDLQTVYSFDTVNDMLDAENLANGSICETLGFYEIGDNGGAKYLIRNVLTTDVIDNIHLFALINNNELVAELIANDDINLKQLGAKIDIDNHNIIVYAFNNFKNICVDEVYPVESHISLEDLSDITVYGKGGFSIDKDYEDSLFLIEDCSNFTFKDIILTNGEKHISSDMPAFAYIMYATGVSYFNFYNIKMIDTYYRGLVFLTSNNLVFKDCLFKDGYYNMVTILTESHDILVDNCIFDTCNCSYSGGSYLFSTGADTYEVTTDYLLYNLTVKNSQFLSNNSWEGIDCHGGNNVTIENNYIEDCLIGIMYGYDERPPVNNIYNENVFICNNKIVNKTLSTARHGIMVTGGNILMGRNYIIKDNYIENYSQASGMYGIYLGYVRDYAISNNTIKKYAIGGIGILATYNGQVEKNYIIENAESSAQAMGVNYLGGNWLSYCQNNQLIGGKTPLYIGVRMANTRGLTLLKNNLCLNTTTKYTTSALNNTVLGAVTNSTDKRFGVQGVHSVNVYDNDVSYCTDTVLRGNGETVSDISFTSTTNVNELTINESTLNVTYFLCIGEEITLEGAGSGGADLTTVILDIPTTKKIIIKDLIQTAVTGVHPVKSSSSWAQV